MLLFEAIQKETERYLRNTESGHENPVWSKDAVGKSVQYLRGKLFIVEQYVLELHRSVRVSVDPKDSSTEHLIGDSTDHVSSETTIGLVVIVYYEPQFLVPQKVHHIINVTSHNRGREQKTSTHVRVVGMANVLNSHRSHLAFGNEYLMIQCMAEKHAYQLDIYQVRRYFVCQYLACHSTLVCEGHQMVKQ